MSIPRKIAYNVIISSTAKILSTIAALVGIGFITRYLGTDGFGMYSTSLAFLSLFSALGDWGIYQTTTTEISRPNANEEKIVRNSITLRVLVSLFITILAPIFISLLPYPRELKLAIILVSFSFVFSSFYQSLIGLFQKRLMMDRVTISEFAGKIIQVTLIVVGVKLNWGFYFIVSTLVINMATNFLIIFWFARKFMKFKLEFDTKHMKKFLGQSLPLGLSALITFIYFKADTILLSLMQPPEDVGIYNAAYKVIENVSFFPAMIVGLTMPMFSFHVFSDRKKFQRIVNENFKVFLILVVPLVVGTMFLADGMISIIAGPEFSQSANILRIIIFALAFIFFGQLFNNVLIVAKLQKKLLKVLIICSIFNVCLNLIFIPKYSYYSTAFTSVATEFLVITLTAFLIYKNLNFLPRFSKFPYIIVAGVFMAISLWLLSGQNFFIRFLISPVVYFVSLIVLNVVSKQEIMSLISKKAEVVESNQ